MIKLARLLLFTFFIFLAACQPQANKKSSKVKSDAGTTQGVPDSESISLFAPTHLTLLTPSPSEISTPTIKVSGVRSNRIVSLYQDSSCSIHSGTALSIGESINITSLPLTAGIFNFYAKQKDFLGNVSPCSATSVSYNFLGEYVAPPAKLELLVSSYNKDQNPIVKIFGVLPKASVELFTDGLCLTQIGKGTVGDNETEVNVQGTVFLDGNYNFYAKQISTSGSSSICSTASVSYQLDKTISTPTAIKLLLPLNNTSNDSTPLLKVEGVENGATVYLYSNSSSCLANLIGIGNSYSADVSIEASISIQGENRIYAKQIDAAGNESSCSSVYLSYLFDSVSPDSSLTALSSSPDASVTPSIISSPTITVNNIESGVYVELYGNGTCTGTLLGRKLSSTTSVDIVTNALGSGTTYTIYAKQIDAAGNSSCSTNFASYTFDGIVSPPTSITLSVPASSPGTDPTPTFNITGIEVGATVKLYRNSNCSSSSLVGSGVESAGSVSITSSALTYDSYNFYAKQIDQAGNESTCSSQYASYAYYDGDPPAALSITLVTPNSSPGATDTVRLRAYGVEAGATFNYFTTADCSNPATGSPLTPVSVSGNVADFIISGLSVGASIIYLGQSYPTSSHSACSNGLTYTYDNTGPSVLNLGGTDTITIYRTGEDLTGRCTLLGLSGATCPSFDDTPELTFTYSAAQFEAGSTLYLFRDNSCSERSGVFPISENSSSLTINTTRLIGDHVYHFYYKIVDSAGNETLCVDGDTQIDYLLDTTDPENISSITLVGDSSPVNDPTPRILIDPYDSGAYVEIYTDSSCNSKIADSNVTDEGGGQLTIDLDGAGLIDISVEQEVPLSFHAIHTDIAGNKSNCSSGSLDIIFDNSLPEKIDTFSLLTTPIYTPANVSSPILRVSIASGLVEANATVTLFSDAACTVGNELGSVGNGSSSVSFLDITLDPLALFGPYTIYAQQMDVAGNINCSSSNFNYEYRDFPNQEMTEMGLLADDFYAASVDIDSLTGVMLIGSPQDDGAGTDRGAVYVYRLVAGTWNLEQTILNPDLEDSAYFGSTVNIEGTRLAVGAENGNGGTGKVYIYDYAGSWTLTQSLTASDAAASDRFGTAMSLDGDRIAIGAAGDDTNTGAVYVFDLAGTWTETQKLDAGVGKVSGDYFGGGALDDSLLLKADNVKLVGNRLFVGAYGTDTGNGAYQGKVYIFELSGAWSLVSTLQATDGLSNAMFGHSLAVDGNHLFVSATNDQSSGAIYHFEYDGSNWPAKQKITPSSLASGDRFGHSISVYGARMCAGSPWADTFGNVDRGMVYCFEYSGSAWQEVASVVATSGADSDKFGQAISLDREVLLIGAPSVTTDTGAGYISEIINPAGTLYFPLP